MDKICKFYIKGKCKDGDNCKFPHVDGICKYNFFGKCRNNKCELNHGHKLADRQKQRQKNTETFEPSHEPADMNIILGNPNNNTFDRSLDPRDVVIVPKLFCEENDNMIYTTLLKELGNTKNNNLFKLWHGDTHYIADDHLQWKEQCPMYMTIVEKIKEYFNMTATATRFNLYSDSNNWKPYHHDAAAVKPHIAKIQNFTVGVSFGAERDISFQHAKNKNVINIPLTNGTTYGFMNQVNVEWRHGIPQLPPHKQHNNGRISIIIWGWRDVN